MNDLLADLADEEHEDLIANGNLNVRERNKEKLRNEWRDENSWKSEGYIARVLVTHCECGADSRHLIGVFHRETTPSGKAREQALNTRAALSIPLLVDGWPTHYDAAYVRFCAACITAKGFRTSTL